MTLVSDSGSRAPIRRRGPSRRATIVLLAVAGVAGLVTVAAMLLYDNIRTRKVEAATSVVRVVDLTEATTDPAEWGKNFPRQYDGYVRTANNPRARFSWSEAVPGSMEHEVASGADDAAATHETNGKAPSKLEADKWLRTIFNGYAFAIDYRERRGHAYMLLDQRETDRVKKKQQPGACLNCHASNVVAYREVGLANGAPGTLVDPLTSQCGQQQLFVGWEHVNAQPYADATKLVGHPMTCLDCHDPATMRLRITRPAFLEGISALANSAEPTPHLPSIEEWLSGSRATAYNPNDLATRQEMRSMTCGQCHVEYYFKGPQKRLTFPWHKGLKAEQMEAYYDETGWNDWTHAESGAPVLKAQHPEFELWSQGIHARAGVSCADCHMPYTREGAMKFSDHQVRTPLANIARSCSTCHPDGESEMLARVDIIQSRTKGLLDRAEAAVVELIHAIREAKDAGATDEALALARKLQRQAQWRADFMNAENSMGFHAPQESMRLLGESVDYARQGIAEAIKVRGAVAPKAAP